MAVKVLVEDSEVEVPVRRAGRFSKERAQAYDAWEDQIALVDEIRDFATVNVREMEQGEVHLSADINRAEQMAAHSSHVHSLALALAKDLHGEIERIEREEHREADILTACDIALHGVWAELERLGHPELRQPLLLAARGALEAAVAARSAEASSPSVPSGPLGVSAEGAS